MGGAMLTGWLAGGLPAGKVVVQDPGPPPEIAALLSQHGIASHQSVADVLDQEPAVLLMAVKPQVMDDVFPPLAKLAGKNTLVLSVAAGRTMAGFEAHLPDRYGSGPLHPEYARSNRPWHYGVRGERQRHICTAGDL